MKLSSIDIPDDKNLIILSQPRSGSTWFQSCFPQYNCTEAFNIRYMNMDEQNGKLEFCFRKQPFTASSEETTRLIAQRIEKINKITVPKSLRVHVAQVEDIIGDWITQQNATIISISRKDKIATFKSLCVALQQQKFIGQLSTESFSVNIDERIKKIYYAIYYVPDSAKRIMDSYDINNFYYEDLLTSNLISHNPPVLEQNTKDIVIENWGEILNYLDDNNLLLK
jgi:hypothetical protein